MSLHCIVLAAGEGRRLRPLTTQCPKPMLPVGNRPLLACNLARIRKAGLTEVGINTFHEQQVMESYLGDGHRLGVNITWRRENQLTGPAGALTSFDDVLDTTELVVISGDALHNIDLSALVSTHRASPASLTVVVKEVENAGRYGVATMDEYGYIKSFEEKPYWAQGRNGLVSCGVYCIDTALVSDFPRGVSYDFGADLIPMLVAQKRPVKAFSHQGYWTDIGTPHTYWRANLDIAEGRVEVPGVEVTREYGQGPVIFGNNVTVGKDAAVVGPAVIGSDVTIGEGAVIQHSVLLPGSQVLPGQHLVEGLTGPGDWYTRIA